jgi:EAL domain-containing protein (putative c-di-GMP-specific phosphodiesterase class I)
MENPEHTAQMLQRIRDLGAGLTLGDFGSGHASLAYLQRFPFDSIKIGQSFVRTNGKGARPVILRSLIALAHDLGMEVVAKGAETDSDAVELYQLGCEYAQGFAFGEPMDADAAMRLLTEERLEAAS